MHQLKSSFIRSSYRPTGTVFFLLFFFWWNIATTQDGVFILVDVSASGPDMYAIRKEAREIVHDICIGSYLPDNYQTEWEWSEVVHNRLKKHVIPGAKPLIDTTRTTYVMIMPFGNKDTYKGYGIKLLNNKMGDFSTFYRENFPNFFNDGQTYIDIARAKAADIAIQRKIERCWLIEITDQLQDTDSRSPNYSPAEQQLIDQYGTSIAQAVKLGTLRHSGQDKNYQILFNTIAVDYENSTVKTPLVQDDTASEPPPSPVLNFVRPSRSGRKNATVIDTEDLVIMWTCRNCSPQNAGFTLRLDCLDCSDDTKPQSKSTTSNKVDFKVQEKGLYKITLALKNSPATNSTTTYVQVNAGSDGGFQILGSLVVFVIMVGILYMIYQQVLSSRKTSLDPRHPGDTIVRPDITEDAATRPAAPDDLEDLFNRN